jgi:hypothetical protein
LLELNETKKSRLKAAPTSDRGGRL